MVRGSWHCTGGKDQDHPQEKQMQKAKWLSKEALQIAEKRKDMKSKGEKERYTHLNEEFQRKARRDKKAFLSNQWKEIEENNRMGRTRDLFKKIRDTKGTFHTKMGTIKGRNGMDLNEAGQRLIEFCQGNALVIANTLFQQHKRRRYTWTSPDGQHQNQTDCILCSQRWRSSI